MGDTSRGSHKSFIRSKDGQPVIYAGDNGPDAVTVRIGQDFLSVMSRGDWEALPIWDGPLPVMLSFFNSKLTSPYMRQILGQDEAAKDAD